MRKFVLIFTAFQLFITAFAQGDGLKRLFKGDPVPDFAFTLKAGDSIYDARLSQYRGKLILLDFWNTRCLDCLSGMVEMNRLQKQFGSAIQIILVTSDSDSAIKLLCKKFEGKRAAASWLEALSVMPKINGDTILSKLFSPTGFPSHAWISPRQTFSGIAYSSSTTEGTIQMALSGGPLELDEQSFLSLDPNNPLNWFAENKFLMDQVAVYSFFLPYIESGHGGGSYFYDLYDSLLQKRNGVGIVNSSILSLYQYAWQYCIDSVQGMPENRIIIETKDSSKFILPKLYSESMKWKKAYSFCYALKLPLKDSANILSHMQSDLDRFFNFESRIETRQVKCYVLNEISPLAALKTKGLPTRFEKFYEDDKEYYRLQNVKVKALYNTLANLLRSYDKFKMLIDRTHYSGSIDIILPWEAINKKDGLLELTKVLQGYGLAITEEFISFPMLVIRDKSK